MHEKTDKRYNFEAKKIELVAWCDKDEPDDISLCWQVIIPRITHVGELSHIRRDNESEKDHWSFYIGLNGKTEWFSYTTEKMAYKKYNELIDKITNFYTYNI